LLLTYFILYNPKSLKIRSGIYSHENMIFVHMVQRVPHAKALFTLFCVLSSHSYPPHYYSFKCRYICFLPFDFLSAFLQKHFQLLTFSFTFLAFPFAFLFPFSQLRTFLSFAVIVLIYFLIKIIVSFL